MEGVMAEEKHHGESKKPGESAANLCLGRQEQGNSISRWKVNALCLAGADFSGSLVRSLIKNNRESNFDNREVHSPRTGKIAELAIARTKP